MITDAVELTSSCTCDTLVFSQHGLSDTSAMMRRLGEAISPERGLVISPNLGFLRTWIAMSPLIDMVEREAQSWLQRYPAAPIIVLGHSMGGLIWLEVLARNPAWWPRVTRLVLMASPVGGADLAQLTRWARLPVALELARDRRELASPIVAAIPTLVIAAGLFPGNDGLVTHESVRLEGARFVELPRVTHFTLRSSALVRRLIMGFLHDANPAPPNFEQLWAKLSEDVDLKATDSRIARLARPSLLFAEGSTVRQLWQGALGEHVFLVSAEGICQYAGRASGSQRHPLARALANLREKYQHQLV